MGSKKEVSLYLNNNGEFVIENYNEAKPLSSFLPGIAGIYGIPMWVFYVNRGQCISCMGITNKDNAILEFFPANRAYQVTPMQSYRTFIKVINGSVNFYEPFQNTVQSLADNVTQKMVITSYDLKLIERNETLGIETTVHYFTVPNESFPALARSVTFKNISNKKIEMQVLDGLPFIIAHGLIHIIQKDLSRTAEAWVEVVNNEQKAPMFRLKAAIADKPEVEHIPDGHFYLSFQEGMPNGTLSDVIVDPKCIFGQITNFSYPSEFYKQSVFNIPSKQDTENFTPCAFSCNTIQLEPNQEKRIFSFIGHVHSIQKLNSMAKCIATPEYFDKKARENRSVIEDLQSNVFTNSASTEFNLYNKQTFLDNVLRGGLPITLETGDSKQIFHVYSRKHGDLERDYNKFSVLPTPFSQGNGNYRDINQNRRNDLWFNSDVADSNIITFMNLIQADGYNPLVIKGSSFRANSEKLDGVLSSTVPSQENRQSIKKLLAAPFTPGDLLKFVEDKDIELKCSLKEFINAVIVISIKQDESDHGEGFWSDHWTYCLDLIESYLSVYPEKLGDLLISKHDYSFYFNKARVAPRNKRYILRNGKPFQGHAIQGIGDQDEWRKKEETISGINTDIHKLKTKEGAIYRTNLLVKLLCLITNKAATLDPNGIGIEMEAGKPNWYDALNGLPGLFGSSSNETFELKRLVMFILNAFKTLKLNASFSVTMPAELYVFIKELSTLLDTYASKDSGNDCFEYWDKSATIKEDYRDSIAHGINGEELSFTADEITRFLNNILTKVGSGLNKAINPNTGLYNAYFMHDMIEYEQRIDPDSNKQLFSQDGFPYIKPKKFVQKPLPSFLEGQVHALRVLTQSEAKNLHNNVRKSDLHDSKLNMYKVNGPLNNQPEEIGRCRLFTPGWLENESVWLHMEYKYMLELLKNSLFEEFYTDFKNVLIPFQNPSRYGRSVLENSSFIVSSAFFEPDLHGNGFVARLSGATAELIHIWLLMNIGKNPFTMNSNDQLEFTFNPSLAGWLFTDKETKTSYYVNGSYQESSFAPNTYAFMLFGKTLVIYNNPSRKNTYGESKAKVSKISIETTNGSKKTINGNCLTGEDANMLRNGSIRKIEAELN